MKRRCGYNRLRVVESTLPEVGYSLFVRAPIVKAGGLLALYEIFLKLLARYEGPYVIVEKVSAVVYVADNGVVGRRVHAVNIKPVARAIDLDPARRLCVGM